MINKFIFIVLLFENLYLSCYTKCVMYEACHSQTKPLTGPQYTVDPVLNNKWFNCYANRDKTSVSFSDYIEPREINDQHGVHLYKKLCPMMYKSDNDKVCCSSNQLKILENDLSNAENIIGSCSSCFLNFRTMWCHMACADNQEKFMRPEKLERKEFTNLTDYFNKYREAMHKLSETEEIEKDIEEDEIMKEEEEEEEEESNTHDLKKRDLPIPNGFNTSVITTISYYLSEEFVRKLIKSCYSVRLYTIIGLQALCGVAPKDCTTAKFGHYLGLEVEARPMDIYFKIDKAGTLFNESGQILTPLDPKVYNCNESYHFPGIEYGSKCSCQSCEESCDVIKPPLKQLDFKIGNIDGVIVVMLIIYLVFVITFVIILLVRRFRRNSVKYHRNPEIIVTQNNNNNNNNLNNNNNSNITSTKKMYRMYNFNYYLQKMDYFGELFENMIENKFSNLGRFCASYPKLVLIIGLSFCSLLCLGFVNFKVEKDPVELWSAESSVARQNKKYFDEKFGPFYRITQMIITSKNEDTTALDVDVVREAFDLYEKILNLTSFCKECNEGKGQRIHLSDICFKPLSPSNDNCAIQSIFEYWKNDHNRILTRLNKSSHMNFLEDCFNNPVQHSCLSSYNAPLAPYLVVGGYTESNYNESKALVITIVINNNKREENLKRAMSWEGAALSILKNFTSSKINVFYTTERSIEDEIERESTADIKIIIISYIAMFLYLTLTLGKYSSIKISVMLLETKVFLGLAGVILVLLSVFSSGGFFTYIGVPATLITLEVIPFLLLAVGVDNIYVMVQTYQNDERRPKEKVEDQIARVVGKVGPSMLLSGVTQSAAFLISAMTPMPGVRAFSLYASLAIILNFILQITCFVVLLTLDAKREDSKRLDILCFIKLSCDTNESEHPKKSFLHRFFSKFYTPFILNDYVRPVIIILFMGFFFVCVSFCDKIKIGFDQKLAMPTDSYQIKYFNALETYLAVGAPVYFVVKGGFDYTNPNDLRKLCGSSTCQEDSLQTIISKASFYNFSYIAEPPVNWIDDYMDWLKPGQCCLMYKNTENKFCDSNIEEESDRKCKKCEVERNNTHRMPKKESFLKYIQYFLQQNPSEICPKGGHAMYKSAVKLNFDGDEFDLSSTERKNVQSVETSHFMTYHTVLSKSEDFINAMQYATQLAQTITDSLNNNTAGTKYEVFPYSIFYVFYEQYLTIWKDATLQLLLTLGAIFICTFVLLSFDIFTSSIVTVLIAIMIIDMVGIMYLWNIELNAVSLVNLVIAIGISVEFSAHIARAFAISNASSRKSKATEALQSMGPPVFSGVLQSIVGISVLAFANSQLFQVFYFRMYFSILLLGLTHGLIFLPVLLSYIGRHSDHTRYCPLNGLNGVQKRRDNDQNELAINASNSQELEIQPLKEKETNLNDDDNDDDDDELIVNVKINNNKTSVNDIKNYSPEKKRNSVAQNNNNNQNSLKNILSPPRTLALNLNNKNDYELKNFHENDAKQIKTPTTPSYHYQANTPTSTNSLKKIMKLNGHGSKKFKHRNPLEINSNGKDYESLDEDIDDFDDNDGFGDDILSQSLTSSNITNLQLNKKSLSKPSLRNVVVPLQSPSISTTRVRTTSGSSNKGASDLIQT